MDRLLVILLAASFALTAVAAVSDHAVGTGPVETSPAAQESISAPVAADPRSAEPEGV